MSVLSILTSSHRPTTLAIVYGLESDVLPARYDFPTGIDTCRVFGGSFIVVHVLYSQITHGLLSYATQCRPMCTRTIAAHYTVVRARHLQDAANYSESGKQLNRAMASVTLYVALQLRSELCMHFIPRTTLTIKPSNQHCALCRRYPCAAALLVKGVISAARPYGRGCA